MPRRTGSRGSNRAKPMQQTTSFRRGGPRAGACRPPRGESALVSHAKRAAIPRYSPAHVTMRLVSGQRSLRDRRVLELLLTSFANSTGRFDCPIVHYSVQPTHLHLIVEAADARALGRGMKGLAVRIAMTLNREWNRSGPLFADRFHVEVLETPRQVRNALLYVLNNARKHGVFTIGGCDPYSSGDRFEGWVDAPESSGTTASVGGPEPCSLPKSWLLRTGWMRHGLLELHAVPGRRVGGALHDSARSAVAGPSPLARASAGRPRRSGRARPDERA